MERCLRSERPENFLRRLMSTNNHSKCFRFGQAPISPSLPLGLRSTASASRPETMTVTVLRNIYRGFVLGELFVNSIERSSRTGFARKRGATKSCGFCSSAGALDNKHERGSRLGDQKFRELLRLTQDEKRPGEGSVKSPFR